MKLKYQTCKEDHIYMNMRKIENIERSKLSKAESWMEEKLKKSWLKFTRQAVWWYRIFDFWNSKLWIAIEVDWPEHNKNWDITRDEYNYKRSGIIVLRVKNFDDQTADKIINSLPKESWMERRERMWLLTKAQKRKLWI